MFEFKKLPMMMIALAFTAPVIAKPVALASSPAPNATVSKPNRIEVYLNEKVAVEDTKVDLTMTAMPGMTGHAAMKIAGFKTTVSADGKTLVAALPRPLPLGTYSVTWSAGSAADRGAGAFTFIVK